MVAGSPNFRYLLRVIPESQETGQPGPAVLPAGDGWELVSSRWDAEGSELLLFRRPA